MLRPKKWKSRSWETPVKSRSEMKLVKLSKGKVAKVDDLDYAVVLSFRWYALFRDGHWHAARTVKRDGEKRTVYMHRQIMGEPVGLLVDHKNLDGLDNRRDNLRVCTKKQNAQNGLRRIKWKSSQFKGVSVSRHRTYAVGRPWRATITVNGKQEYLGWYATEVEAAIAYDTAARTHFKEFACTNF
jgi:hypothetical protein